MSRDSVETTRRRPFSLVVTAVAALVLLALSAPSAQAAVPGVTVPGQSAGTYVLWTRCQDVLAMSDATLATWKSRGVDGFTCDITYVRGLGGAQDFTADPNSTLTGANFTLQKQMRD